jgi:hypothetical protein
MRTESLGLRLVLICPSSGVVLYPRVSRKNGGTVVLNSIASGLPSNPVIALVSTRIWGFRLPQKHEGNGRYLKIPFSAFGCRIWTSTSSLFTTNCRTQICSSSISKKTQSTLLSNRHSRRKSVLLKLAFPAFSLRRFMMRQPILVTEDAASTPPAYPLVRLASKEEEKIRRANFKEM